MLGEELPDHVRPSIPRALRVSAVWLLLWLVPVAALLIGLGQANVFSQIALFFSKMALVTFGGAYAVLAYVAQQAVEHYHWVQPREMLDGLGMAETTPGPLIMVLQFVGFMAAFRDPGTLSPMLAGTLGGLLATWVTFTPCFLWIFLGAPFIETLRGNKGLAGALTAITAAVVGVILNLSIWFALHTVFRETAPVRSFGLSFDMPVPSSVDLPALALAIAAATAIFRFKLGMLTVLAGSCVAGGAAAAGGGDLNSGCAKSTWSSPAALRCSWRGRRAAVYFGAVSRGIRRLQHRHLAAPDRRLFARRRCGRAVVLHAAGNGSSHRRDPGGDVALDRPGLLRAVLLGDQQGRLSVRRVVRPPERSADLPRRLLRQSPFPPAAGAGRPGPAGCSSPMHWCSIP